MLLNSGCANCLTGPPGMRDARRISRTVANALGIEERELVLASTGLIGRRLPVVRMQRAVPELVRRLSRTSHADAAAAVLTTDRTIKEAALEARIGGRPCRLGGMAKGAGMIEPSMATMLCVISTDAAMAPSVLRAMLRRACAQSFNRITVDGDMSTNDTVVAFASGQSGVTIRPGTPAAKRVARMLEAVTQRLATKIVQDGEGASRIMEVQVVGARTEPEAEACARRVANSPLVKTMLGGGDPNIGRAAAAIGASSARFNADRLSIRVGDRLVVSRGTVRPLSKARAARLFRRPWVTMLIDLHAGRAAACVLTCDLSEAYVRINARYTT